MCVPGVRDGQKRVSAPGTEGTDVESHRVTLEPDLSFLQEPPWLLVLTILWPRKL